MIFPIVTDKKTVPGDPQNIMDLVKTQAILDHRGQSDLVTKDDDYFMRGYSTAGLLQHLTVWFEKNRGRKASDIVVTVLSRHGLFRRPRLFQGPIRRFILQNPSGVS
jgi:hypothetical protein